MPYKKIKESHLYLSRLALELLDDEICWMDLIWKATNTGDDQILLYRLGSEYNFFCLLTLLSATYTQHILWVWPTFA
jgi:hypothetical protein